MLYQKIKRRLDKYILKVIPSRIYKYYISRKINANMTFREATALLSNYRKNRATTSIIDQMENNGNSGGYDLSIIVPCYNVQEYVEQCMDSILNQKTTYSYIIYLIDDGSTDGTYRVMSKYADSSQVKILRSTNNGAGHARNMGLNEVNTPYIMFVDADDYLTCDCVEKLMTVAYKYNADIVEGGLRYFDEDNKTIWKKKHENEVFDIGIEAPLFGFPVAKVIKSRCFDDIRFPEIGYEDTLGIYTFYPQAQKCCLIDDIVYNYRKNNNGCTRKIVNDFRQLDTVYVTEQLLKDALALNIDVQYLYRITLNQIITNYSRIYYMNFDIQMAVFVITCNIFDTYFSEMKIDNPSFKNLETSIKNHDFASYYRYMRMHG